MDQTEMFTTSMKYGLMGKVFIETKTWGSFDHGLSLF